MRKKLVRHLKVVALFALLATEWGVGPALAQSSATAGVPAPASQSGSIVPRKAFFIGLGGSFNSVGFNNQNVYAQGISNVYQNGTQVAYGAAGGPADPYSNTRATFAPVIQVGYFQHFTNSEWFWGGKFLFSYLGANSINQALIIPQVGSFTSANSDSFTGNVVARSFEMATNSQLALMPIVGHSFANSTIYAGAGPTLSETQYKLNGVIGFADINGTHTDITGTSSNFSSSQWVLGGAFTVGGTYYFTPTWFLDINYTYAITGTHTASFSGPFASSSYGYTDTGILSGTYSGRVTTQSLAVSLNKAF